jgi:hypothetical protein
MASVPVMRQTIMVASLKSKAAHLMLDRKQRDKKVMG